MPARSEPAPVSRDPLGWCWVIALGFLALVLQRLAIPSKPYFDEVHYLPAARALLALAQPLNTEHPPLGKELIAAGIALLGDRPLAWRLPAALAGTAALFAGMRAVWWASLSRPATLLTGVLLASNFLLFVIARIAMLDAFMLGFALVALWLCAHAVRRPERARRDLVLAGIALGCALASKWSVAPLLPLPGLAFAAARWVAMRGRRHVLLSERGFAPIPEVALFEAALWLGLLPLLVYFASFAPALFAHSGALRFGELLDLQVRMATLQASVVQPHPYQSVWWQWLLDLRPIWFLYEVADGAQRGVLLLGNPVTMLAGLPALLLCAAWGAVRRDPAMLGVVALYAASLAMWLVALKPVQFYYHYLLPGTFLCAALGLVLGRWWERGRRWPAQLLVAAALGLFAFFYPILSAAPLENEQAFLTWTWLDSWR